MQNDKRFTAVELFAGAGGLSLGLENSGLSVVLANEIMPDFAATLIQNHPHTRVLTGDIHDIDFKKEIRRLNVSNVDVVSGGNHFRRIVKTEYDVVFSGTAFRLNYAAAECLVEVGEVGKARVFDGEQRHVGAVSRSQG